MAKAETSQVVYRVLLLKCVSDLHEGAIRLHSRVGPDKGTGLTLSAFSLAQKAHETLEHVQKIRYTKAYFAQSPVTPVEKDICARYMALEGRFQKDVFDRLTEIAGPAQEHAHDSPGFVERLRRVVEGVAPGEFHEALEQAGMSSGRLTDAAPEMVDVLADIISKANDLLEEIKKLGPMTDPA